MNLGKILSVTILLATSITGKAIAYVPPSRPPIPDKLILERYDDTVLKNSFCYADYLVDPRNIRFNDDLNIKSFSMNCTVDGLIDSLIDIPRVQEVNFVTLAWFVKYYRMYRIVDMDKKTAFYIISRRADVGNNGNNSNDTSPGLRFGPGVGGLNQR